MQKLEAADEKILKARPEPDEKKGSVSSYGFLLLALGTGTSNGSQVLLHITVVKRFRPPPLPVEQIFAYSFIFDNPDAECQEV